MIDETGHEGPIHDPNHSEAPIIPSELKQTISQLQEKRQYLVEKIKTWRDELLEEDTIKNQKIIEGKAGEILFSQCYTFVQYTALNTPLPEDYVYFDTNTHEPVCTNINGHTILGIANKKTKQVLAIDLTPQQTNSFADEPIDSIKIFGPFDDNNKLVDFLGNNYIAMRYDFLEKKQVPQSHSRWVITDLELPQGEDPSGNLLGQIRSKFESACKRSE